MRNNPYRYDKNTAGQIPPQQPYNNTYPGMYMNQPPGAPQALKTQQLQARGTHTRTTSPARMPKAKALGLVRLFKRSLVVMSLATFASISGLVAYHQVDSTSSQKSSASTTSASQQKNNTFFNQQGDNNLGTSTPAATATPDEPTATATTDPGSSSGSDSNPSSVPVSGSHTS